MNRIDKKFKQLKKEKKKAFIAYITAGDPSLKATKDLVLELERRGTDIVELGVPFSDPLADGPTIQAASERALKKGVDLTSIFNLVKKIRVSSQIPIVLMTYYNPVLSYGVKRFVDTAAAKGVDGVIIPDLPPEEAKELIAASRKKKFSTIFLLAPTSPAKRIKMISKYSGGFIYYVSLTGVTGARESLPKEVTARIKAVRRAVKKPVCVGFGISTALQVKQVLKAADGVIVGSAIIKTIQKNLKDKNLVKRVGNFIEKLSEVAHG